MKFQILGLTGALLAFAPTASAEQPTGPSFNCDKASTAVEKAICGDDGGSLAWWDRQLAKAWKLAQNDLGDEELASLRDSQKLFLKRRNACSGKNAYSCIADAYADRVAELAAASGEADFFSGSYASDGGEVNLVAYPNGTAALDMSTVGANTHTCGFQVDDAELTSAGAIRWSQKPDEMYDDACTVTAIRVGLTLDVASDGMACTYYCGARATLDGEFTLKD